ncbi:carbohydrate ABC transporter permease [Tessaracoccus flavus]|jgi:raffinose/stachyose/melibiose transport system permease protein|uniref:Thiamine ABC transporter ATP-binding protein n=1 Tax=Tessaracoccus flavus TaxID=1610493 RepID=A0A1Q2CGT8_9ACTN|nr:carbohydrate ABC transporter permease [Tessaracoccus flavus]AQP45326.1 thiamine ABC transporter ATP-binding protein [Tessaracoccus flavus]SDY48702.1 carbohydrate ABC transporter membrane protein 2, CUT1 family [Tessaracoccus flavus]
MSQVALTSRGRKARRPYGGTSRKSSVPWGKPSVYLIATVLIAICIGPVLYIILGGFRSNAQITTDPSGMPNPWVFSNYTEVLTAGTFWQQFGNSVISAVLTTVGCVSLALAASYVIARYNFRGRNAMFSLFAAGLMFPMTVAITPLYILIRSLGLTNTLAGIILPQIGFALPVTVIILVPFLRAIPKEIEEAAMIDGSGRVGFFFRMVLPLSLPGVITTGILAFIGAWNNYMLPLFILSDPAKYTLPLGVQAFASQYSVNTAAVLAFTSLSMLPALLFFSVFERRIVGGLTGAIKG